jgi:hypothetical protein
MTDAERRERARLRSERWRRAHGIMPRRPALRPWLALGISRSTYYRRRKKSFEGVSGGSSEADRVEARFGYRSLHVRIKNRARDGGNRISASCRPGR